MEDPDVDGRIMLMNLIDIVREGLDLIHLAQDREKWQKFVDTSVAFRDL